jgi:hypothetical protein
MCLRRAPEKYIAGAAFDRAGLDNVRSLTSYKSYRPRRPFTGTILLLHVNMSNIKASGFFGIPFYAGFTVPVLLYATLIPIRQCSVMRATLGDVGDPYHLHWSVSVIPMISVRAR